MKNHLFNITVSIEPSDGKSFKFNVHAAEDVQIITSAYFGNFFDTHQDDVWLLIDTVKGCYYQNTKPASLEDISDFVVCEWDNEKIWNYEPKEILDMFYNGNTQWHRRLRRVDYD